jgi:hypothetical protein
MKNQITIRVNAETKEKINPFKNKPGKGYIILEQSQIDYSMGWANAQIRTCTLKGTIELLEQIINTPLKGKIVIREYLESEIEEGDIIPLEIQKYLENEKNYESSVKKTAKDGIELTRDGELIFKFSTYDPTGLVEDRFIDHDNNDEVKEWRSNK